MSRWTRNERKRSRPEGLGNPHPTRQTAESYDARYKSDGRPNFLRRLRRLQARELDRKDEV